MHKTNILGFMIFSAITCLSYFELFSYCFPCLSISLHFVESCGSNITFVLSLIIIFISLYVITIFSMFFLSSFHLPSTCLQIEIVSVF